MNESLSSILGLLIAVAFMLLASCFLPQIDLRLRIKKYNKKYHEHVLDENTNFSVYNNRYNDWLLEMFCDEKKGNDQNEK